MYSLGANAWEVIDVLCVKTGVSSMSVQARQNVPSGKDLKWDYINAPYRNFFKHADRDADAELPPLTATHVEGLLYLAVEDYIRLYKRSPVQLQVFQLWYLAKYPEKLDASVAGELIADLRVAFPDLPSLSYEEQLEAGRRAVAEGATDSEILSDPRTEPTFDGKGLGAG